MRDDAELRPWFDHAVGLVPGVEIYDAHMHVGHNDPDGFKADAGQITDALKLAGARGVIFPFHEPDGYSEANTQTLADLLWEAGAVEIVESPRQMGLLLALRDRMVAGHDSRVGEFVEPRSFAEWAWSTLPWQEP